jgi:hypothetical protein
MTFPMWWHLGKPLPEILITFFWQVNLLISSSLSNMTPKLICFIHSTPQALVTPWVTSMITQSQRDCKLHFVTSIVHNFAIYDFYSLICSPTLKMVQKWMPCFSNNIKMEWVCTNYTLNPKYCIHCWFLENSITNTKSLVLYVATRTTASRGQGQGSRDKGERKHIFDKNNQTNSQML